MQDSGVGFPLVICTWPWAFLHPGPPVRLSCRCGPCLSLQAIPNWKSHWPLTTVVFSDSTSRWWLVCKKRHLSSYSSWHSWKSLLQTTATGKISPLPAAESAFYGQIHSSLCVRKYRQDRPSAYNPQRGPGFAPRDTGARKSFHFLYSNWISKGKLYFKSCKKGENEGSRTAESPGEILSLCGSPFDTLWELIAELHRGLLTESPRKPGRAGPEYLHHPLVD